MHFCFVYFEFEIVFRFFFYFFGSLIHWHSHRERLCRWWLCDRFCIAIFTPMHSMFTAYAHMARIQYTTMKWRLQIGDQRDEKRLQECIWVIDSYSNWYFIAMKQMELMKTSYLCWMDSCNRCSANILLHWMFFFFFAPHNGIENFNSFFPLFSPLSNIIVICHRHPES